LVLIPASLGFFLGETSLVLVDRLFLTNWMQRIQKIQRMLGSFLRVLGQHSISIMTRGRQNIAEKCRESRLQMAFCPRNRPHQKSVSCSTSKHPPFRVFLQSSGSRPLSRDSIFRRNSAQISHSQGAMQRQILFESLGYKPSSSLGILFFGQPYWEMSSCKIFEPR
jgi:hypothetical protein